MNLTFTAPDENGFCIVHVGSSMVGSFEVDISWCQEPVKKPGPRAAKNHQLLPMSTHGAGKVLLWKVN